MAASLILQGHSSSVEQFNLSMQAILPAALHQLGAVSAKDTRFQFDMLDGNWWDSHRAVPEKFLVLKRNYLTDDDRIPTPIPSESTASLRLRLPAEWAGFQMKDLGELRLLSGRSMKQLPKPDEYYTFRDFPALALHARAEDAGQLAEMK